MPSGSLDCGIFRFALAIFSILFLFSPGFYGHILSTLALYRFSFVASMPPSSWLMISPSILLVQPTKMVLSNVLALSTFAGEISPFEFGRKTTHHLCCLSGTDLAFQ
ncbi:hypothetical protein T440DRAFT_144646 [Plenodomus tracheiphilus IPT5]|uniref:Uncharacterized protein n=1 Tax=Plenodomus tracheiphilus IPT5 TaxID=1408161 RepID=A0A6A7B0H2_9PLEO|nr:hypothetical protein T440DRAFT_144646 [Plenodomus tracheiphilus IPT5]